jgi:hypothetical protein
VTLLLSDIVSLTTNKNSIIVINTDQQAGGLDLLRQARHLLHLIACD